LDLSDRRQMWTGGNAGARPVVIKSLERDDFSSNRHHAPAC
jgi:hypothetical protein